ncbi:MAG TPA: ATP-binding protein, partial [Terriglobales bacterium]|nr:ATP-binding protein [Terriglobales bacterium]
MAKSLAIFERLLQERRHYPSLRVLLIALVTGALLPLFLLLAWLITLQSQREMEALEMQLVDLAQRIAGDVDREVASTLHSLQTLALDFDPEADRSFQELSNRTLSARQAWKTIIVRDASGKPVITISKSPSPFRWPNSQAEPRREVEKSPFAFLLGSSVAVQAPIRVNRKITYLALVLLDPQVFEGILTKHKVSSDWLVSILDPKKIVVASTRFADKFFGKPTEFLLPSSGHSAPGHFFRRSIDNAPYYVVLTRAPLSQWSVTLAVPAAVVEAPYYRNLWFIVGIASLCLIAAIMIAYLIGRRVTRPFERLAAHTRERTQGEPADSFPKASIAEVQAIDKALDRAARQLKEQEVERDYFSEELDERLQCLTGLHKLTAGLLAIDDCQALFTEMVAGALVLLNGEKGSLHLVDPSSREISLAAQIGFAGELPDCLYAVAGKVTATGRAFAVEDIEDGAHLKGQERKTALHAGLRSVRSFPLAEQRGNIIGALSVYFSQPFKAPPWQQIVMDLYAHYCVNIIQQTQEKRKLQAHSNGLEDQVKEHARKLEEAYLQRINDLTRQKELEKDLREAQKMELIGNLAAGVAHDFNNILNIILSYASTLNTKDPKETSEHAQVIEETAKRGASIVRQLLAVARKADPKFEPTDLNGFLRTLTDILKQTFPKNITLVTRFDPRVLSVMVDSNQIGQAVINLCVNARDAMPHGGTLTMETQYLDAKFARERFAAAKDVPHGCIRVSDTGTGIRNEAKEHVFEPFFTTKGRGHGTGLGLSVAYRIMQTHDGFIHFESQPGHGTSFYLCFPIREATRLAEPETESVELNRPSSLKNANVLIVEDEPNQVTLLQRVLENKGCRILTAENGNMALDVFRKNQQAIAAVLLDFGLPGK